MLHHLVNADGCLPGQLAVAHLYHVPDVGHRARVLVLPLDVADVAHHHVHDGVLNQAEEDEQGARGHEHVDRLEMVKKF